MILEIKNIRKSFGEKKVLEGISFSAVGGEAMGLLGRNGAGKTTTLRILMNVFEADSGEILLNGSPINYSKVGFGYLPEERGLYPKRPIMEQLVYFATLKGMSKSDAIRSVDYWLRRLEVTEYKNRRLETLSKGNQQKIQLITALAHNPQIVILDEPFSGLDPVNAMMLKEVVREQIAMGKIVLFSSHQMSYIEEFCDSIAILSKGKIAISGNLAEIKRKYPRNKLVIKTRDANKIMKDLPFSSEKIRENTLVLKLDNADSKMDVMKNLASSCDIDEIKVFEPSLSDIFVEYTGDDERGENV